MKKRKVAKRGTPRMGQRNTMLVIGGKNDGRRLGSLRKTKVDWTDPMQRGGRYNIDWDWQSRFELDGELLRLELLRSPQGITYILVPDTASPHETFVRLLEFYHRHRSSKP
jgi:hypothetical protein